MTIGPKLSKKTTDGSGKVKAKKAKPDPAKKAQKAREEMQDAEIRIKKCEAAARGIFPAAIKTA